MRAEVQYKSKIFGECPSDYDFTKITNLEELKLLNWIHILQSIVTRLHLNIQMYQYYIRLYMFNKVVREQFKTYYTYQLNSLSAMITIDFSCLLHKENELNVYNLKNFCSKNKNLFIHDITIVLKKTKNMIKSAEDLYKTYFDIPRKKIFAHIDELLLEQEKVNEIMKKGSTKTMKKILWYLKRFLNEIWTCYNDHKLCFQLENGNDYKKITELICKHYGDTRFL